MSEDDLATNLGYAAGAVIAALLRYFPKLNTWYAGLGGTAKRILLLAIVAVLSVAFFLLSCAKLYSWVSCDQAGGERLVFVFLKMVIASQASHLILPEPKAVLERKARRPKSAHG